MISHPLQSPAWEQFRNAMGVTTVRTNSWLLTFHKVPLTPWTIGYFPKGPAPTQAMVSKLIKLGKQMRAIFIQLEPNTSKINIKLPKSHHPLFTQYTFILDLTKTQEELLSSMHPKTRYNIKVAQKHGVIIKKDDNAFENYLRLTRETTNRQRYYAHSETYHRTMWEIMHKAGIAHLFTASYNQKVLCAWIVFVWGDTLYYPYGASSREHKEVMAPTLLLWEIVKWAKDKGLKRFDLWGAIGPTPSSKDPWYGFHRFKQGFGPTLYSFAGSFDIIINKPLYLLYRIADTMRWRILHAVTTVPALR